MKNNDKQSSALAPPTQNQLALLRQFHKGLPKTKQEAWMIINNYKKSQRNNTTILRSRTDVESPGAVCLNVYTAWAAHSSKVGIGIVKLGSSTKEGGCPNVAVIGSPVITLGEMEDCKHTLHIMKLIREKMEQLSAGTNSKVKSLFIDFFMFNDRPLAGYLDRIIKATHMLAVSKEQWVQDKIIRRAFVKKNGELMDHTGVAIGILRAIQSLRDKGIAVNITQQTIREGDINQLMLFELLLDIDPINEEEIN